MVVKSRYLIPVLLILCSMLSAQSVRVMASVNKNTLAQNEAVIYTIRVTSNKQVKITEPQAPGVDGLRFSGMTSGLSQSTSYIGNQFTTQVSQEYRYTYYPTRTGKITIPAQTVRADGQSYSVAPIHLEIRSAPVQPPQTPSRRPSAPGYDPFSFFDDQPREEGESFILSLPETQTVFRGEPAIVRYYLYTNQDVRSYSNESVQDFDGYGKALYDTPRTFNWETVRHNDRTMKRALLKSYVLYPQRTGIIRAPQLSARIRWNYYSFFEKKLSSSVANVAVKELPSGAPASFGGAIGNFQFSEKLSATELKLGEAVTYTLQISGLGNFYQFSAPLLTGNAELQISTPQVKDQMQAGYDGTRYVYYTLIPRKSGEIHLPKLEFSWLDKESGIYRVFTGKGGALNVKQGSVSAASPRMIDPNDPANMHRAIPMTVYPLWHNHAHRLWYWLLVAILLLSLPVSVYMARIRKLHILDPKAYADKKAGRALNEFSRLAVEAATKKSSDFYSLAEKGLISYVNTKYQIPQHLGTRELLDALDSTDITAELKNQIAAFMDICNMARFMPGGSNPEHIARDGKAFADLVNELQKPRNHWSRK